MPTRHRRLLAILWTLAILVACSIPGQDLPEVQFQMADKVVHFLLFAVLGLLWMHALQGSPNTRALWVLAAGAAYAVLTELYQGLLPFHRSPDVYDMLANMLGLLAAVVAYRLWHLYAQAQRT